MDSKLDRALSAVRLAKECAGTRLNTQDVQAITGWSRTTLHRRVKAGHFPEPVERGRWHGGSVLQCLEASKSA